MIDKTSQLIDANIASSATLYKNVRAIRSVVGEQSTVGDFTTVRDSQIGDYCQIQRHCDILRTKIGNYTVIEKNAVLHDVIIGAMAKYSPEELELYLMDFKIGVNLAKMNQTEKIKSRLKIKKETQN